MARDTRDACLSRRIEAGGRRSLAGRQAFNYARLNNEAVQRLDTPFVCFLNNDVEVITPTWLSAMLCCFARPGVGGAGAKLVWPNGMLQHGGVVTGLNYAAGHAYDRYLASEAGYADGILAARECSALTAACLLVRRSDFIDVGGFDEQAFPVTFNDVDLCLKLRCAGKVLVWTPEASFCTTSPPRAAAISSRLRSAAARQGTRGAEAALGARVDGRPYYNPISTLMLSVHGSRHASRNEPIHVEG